MRSGNSSAGAGQALGVFLAEIALVEIERRLAVELEQHVALGAGDAAARAELVPAAGAAVADADRSAVEADGGDACRCCGAPSAPTRVSSNRAPSPASPPVSGTSRPTTSAMPATSSLPLTFKPSDRTKMPARSSALSARPIASPQARECSGAGAGSQASRSRVAVEAQRHRDDFVVADVVVADLSAGAAADDVGAGKHRAQLAIARAVGERRTGAEVQDQVGACRAQCRPCASRAPRSTTVDASASRASLFRPQNQTLATARSR